jgi:hypothetical protein
MPFVGSHEVAKRRCINSSNPLNNVDEEIITKKIHFFKKEERIT